MRPPKISAALTLALCLTVSGQESQSDSSGVVEGQVLNLEGSPIPEADVCAIAIGVQDQGRIPRTRANSEGRFTLKIERPGSYLISAWHEDDGYPNPALSAYGPPAVPVPEVVVDQRQARQAITVRVGPRAGSLCAAILDGETNRPVEGGRVELRQSSNWAAFRMDVPWTKGQFQLLAPTGLFSLRVSAPGYEDWYGSGSKEQPQLFAVEAGDRQEIVVRLRTRATR
jgi:hypothetical protein